jgi:allantoinase
MVDFIIKSKNVILPTGVKDAFVLIKDGLIVDIVSALPGSLNIPIVDVGTAILMAGIIDPHVHINEPGRTDWEGFETATKAALAGGITTLVDMPLNSSPVTTSVKAFEEKLSAATKNLHTNVGIWGGVVPGNENEIVGLIEKGVLGFKAFLTHSGIDEFPNATEEDLRKVLPVIAKHNVPLLVHCELTDNVQHSALNAQPNSYKNYLSSRPKKWEDDAIDLAIRLCEEYNCHTHIVHLSSANTIERISKAKEQGLPLTVETAQHYLYFSAEEIADGQTQFKCAPPIRESENNELLWQALQDGIIDFVATDHSPAPPKMKQLVTGSFTKAWGGIASLQFALPVLWTAAKRKSASVNDIAKWLSENPSHIIGKQKSKGKIAKGFDADLVVWSPEKKFVVSEGIVQHKHKLTPYLGKELYGVVEQTYLSGRKVYDNGAFIELHYGKIIIR